MGRSGLARDPENGWRTEHKGQKKEEEEQIPRDPVLAFPGRHLLPQVLLVLITLQYFDIISNILNYILSFSLQIPA